jgi:hypothetical protein
MRHRDDWLTRPGPMRAALPRLIGLLFAVGCIVHPAPLRSQTLACPAPSAGTLDDVQTFKEILSDTDSVRVAYRAGLGLAGIPADSVIAVADPAICSAVTAAVVAELHETAPITENLYVLRVGPRYLALDPHGNDLAQFLLTLSFAFADYLVP